MSALPPIDAIVSNPETQLQNTNVGSSSIDMSNNDTLPASALEAPSALRDSDRDSVAIDSTLAIPSQQHTQPDASSLPSQPPPPPQESQLLGANEPAPIRAQTNGDHTVFPLQPLTTTSLTSATMNGPASPITPKPPSHSPAPTRGSTPAPSSSLNNMGPSHIINSANGETGSPTRAYMNTKVTPSLLEGMKWVARNEPEKPLKWLAEYLMARSKEIEGL